MRLWACPKCPFRTEQPDSVTDVLHTCTNKVSVRLKKVVVPRVNVRAAIVAESLARFPEEACGFVLSSGTVVAAKNVSPEPSQNFQIDPATAELWWPTGMVTGVWHSHCFDSAVPSNNDQDLNHPGLECWIYSVMDEQLGIYRPNKKNQLQLVSLEDLS